jgi:hypothetical protein
MTINSLESELFIDLPDHFAGAFDLKPTQKEVITSACFSPHAFIIAIGTVDGRVSARDTLSCTNHRVYSAHDSEVSALSFSRDTHHLASADKHGTLKIHSVDDCILEFTHSFDSRAIQAVEFSPTGGNHLLILLDDGTLHFLSDMSHFTSPPGQFSCAKWSYTTLTFFAAIEKAIAEIDFPSFSVVHRWDFEDSKIKLIVSMAVSRNDHFLVFLDSSGVGRCFSLVVQTIVAQYSERVDRVKFAHAIFDRRSEYVIIGSKAVTAKALRVFRVEDGVLVRTFPGHREPILQLFAHPLDAVIFARCRSGIVKWEPSMRYRMMNSVPPTGCMRCGVDFEEPEDCFDLPSSDEPEPPAPASANHGGSLLDLLTPVDAGYFADDKDYPDQLFVLSWPPPASVCPIDADAAEVL